MKSPSKRPKNPATAGLRNQREARKAGAAVIDTSKMAKRPREALELAEAARDPLEDAAVCQ